MIQRLYVLVRSDLKPGLQAAQACHALQAFNTEHPEAARIWYYGGNNLIVLNVANEAELLAMKRLCDSHGIPTSVFNEPDLRDAPTAVALGGEARSLVSHLPLALRDEPLRHAKKNPSFARGWLQRLGARLLYT